MQQYTVSTRKASNMWLATTWRTNALDCRHAVARLDISVRNWIIASLPVLAIGFRGRLIAFACPRRCWYHPCLHSTAQKPTLVLQRWCNGRNYFSIQP